jgi:cell division septal protein FtsQ
VTRKYLPRVRYVLLFIILVTFAYGFYYVLVGSSLFKVARINVFGAKSFVSAQDVNTVVSDRVSGVSIFQVDDEGLEKNLIEVFQGAKDIRVHKVLPSTVNVEVFERVPLALVYKEDSPDLYMVDDEGYILGIVEDRMTNLPKISYEGEVKVGFFIDSNVVPIYLELVQALNTEQVKTSSISFYSKYALIYVSDGIELRVGNDKDKAGSIKTASNLIRQLTLEGKKLKKIDLRYDKVIVLYD